MLDYLEEKDELTWKIKLDNDKVIECKKDDVEKIQKI